MLGAKPEYKLSADINSHKAGTILSGELPLYLAWTRFFLINHFCLCVAVVSNPQPLSKWLRRNALKRLNGSKNCMFLATSENLNGSSLLQSTWNPQLDNSESDLHAVFYSIFWYNPKSYCTSLVLSFALFTVMLKHKCMHS